MTSEIISRAEELHAQNIGYGQIAKILNVSKDTLKSALRRKTIREQSGRSRCAICGKVIEVKSIGKKRLYCSDRCRYLAWKEKNKDWKRKRTKPSICLYCGKEFLGYSCHHQKFCSRECLHKYQRERK